MNRRARKFYVACAFGYREDAQTIALHLVAATGQRSCARWLTLEGEKDESLSAWAVRDMEDIYEARTLVWLQTPNARGGALVEVGMALALGKEVLIVENFRGKSELPVFAHLPSVRCFATVGDMVRYMLATHDGNGWGKGE